MHYIYSISYHNVYFNLVKNIVSEKYEHLIINPYYISYNCMKIIININTIY